MNRPAQFLTWTGLHVRKEILVEDSVAALAPERTALLSQQDCVLWGLQPSLRRCWWENQDKHFRCRRVSWWGTGERLWLIGLIIDTRGNFGFLGASFACEPPYPPSSTLWTRAKAGFGPSTWSGPRAKNRACQSTPPCTRLIECLHLLLLQHDEHMNLAQPSALRYLHFFFLRIETKRSAATNTGVDWCFVHHDAWTQTLLSLTFGSTLPWMSFISCDKSAINKYQVEE